MQVILVARRQQMRRKALSIGSVSHRETCVHKDGKGQHPLEHFITCSGPQFTHLLHRREMTYLKLSSSE